MRTFWVLLSLTICATSAAAEAPYACRSGLLPPKYLFGIEDLATGKLPIPDYRETAFMCLSGGPPVRVPEVPASPWLEGERDLYSSVLATQPADILIVPVQIQGYGFDRIERAMMTADLAYAIGDAGGKVADPFLTALALGEGDRRLNDIAVEKLARKVGARKILWTYAGHDFKHTFTLTVRLQDLQAAPGARQLQRDWRSMPFTNERTPAYAFHEMLPAVLKELPLGLDPKRIAAARLAPTPTGIGSSPLALVSTGSKSGADIATTSLLAALVPTGAERARERLFERAWLMAMRANVSKPELRFFEAYALLNLHRRPVALARIEGAGGPSFDALRALLDGNLPAAQSATAAVKNPLERLLLQIELRDLEFYYGVQKPTEAAVTALFAEAALPAWRPLLDARLNDGDQWYALDAVSVKETLDQTFPNKVLGLESLARGMAVVGNAILDDIAIDLASVRQTRQVATNLKVAACCRSQELRTGSWDLLWALEGWLDERIVRHIEQDANLRGLRAEAMADVARYEPLLKGHPRLTALSAYTAARLSLDSPDDERASWLARAGQDGGGVMHWSAGQNRTSALGTRVDRSILAEVYGYDFPRRPYWPTGMLNEFGPEPQAIKIAWLTEALAFSTRDASPFSELRTLPGNAVTPESFSARFAGNPRRPLPPAPPPPREASARLAATAAEAKSDPSKNLSLGYQLLLMDQPFQQALDAFLAYPPFQKREGRNRVALSSEVYQAGSQFFWLGQGDLSRPLFQIAADLGTGSEAEMASQQRLLLLDGDFLGAVQMASARSQRYSSAFAQRDFLSLLHAFGEHEAAWDAFEHLRAGQGGSALWTAAVVGQRKQKLSDAAVRAWLKSPQIRNAKFTSQLFASYYALLWYSTDRMPPADLEALVVELEGAPVARIDVSGVGRPHPVSAGGGLEIVQPNFTPPSAAKVARPEEGTPVKSERAYFAAAYSAVVRGEYAKAVERFEAMALLYPIENAALPYFSYAASHTGDPSQLEEFVAVPDTWDQPGFDVLLSRAFFAAGRKQTDESYRLLRRAFRNKPMGADRQVDVDYQFAQACEWLYRDTKDARFSALLLEWSRNYQRVNPAMAWSYAVQYQYETEPDARSRALAMTLHLDPLSDRIRKASPAEIDKARAWLDANNPFRVPTDEDKAAAKTAAAW